MRAGLAAAAAVLALATPQAAAAAAPPSPAPAGGGDGVVTTQLSDEARLSRWAYPVQNAPIRALPSAAAPVRGVLRLQTEDGLPETYLLLQERKGPGEEDWVQLRIPGRPNGRIGWVPREALDDFRPVTTALTVDRGRHRVEVRRAGRLIRTFPIGVGKASTATPSGRFWIREKFAVRPSTGIYGPFALGTSAYAPHLTDWPGGGVVGFHGTNEPGLVPGNPSHGCIRLRNRDVRELYRLTPVGTPVHIV